jgi:PST family polysaccharide transporter
MSQHQNEPGKQNLSGSTRAVDLPEPVKNGEAPAQPPRVPSLASNLAWRALANWSSQLVSWAALLVIVRLLNPADFGLVGMAVMLYSFLRYLGACGITQSVIRHRNLSEETLAQLNTMSLIIGVGTFLLGCLAAWPVSWFFKSPRMVPVAIVASLSLIPLGLRGVPEGLVNQQMRLKSLSLFDALRDILSAIITILLAWLGCGYWALVFGNLLPDIARCAMVLHLQRCRFAWPRFSVIREPLVFGMRLLVNGLSWSTYTMLDNVTVGRVLGRAALGLYGMAWTLANVPLEKVVALVTTLIPAYLSRVQTDMAATRRYVWSLTETIALLTFPATIGMALVAGDTIPLVMGVKWTGMVAPLRVLCFYAAFRSLIAMLPRVLSMLGKVRFVMWMDLSLLVTLPLAFWVGSHWGITGIAFGWIFVYPIFGLAEYWKTMKTIQMKVADYIGALRPALDGSIAMAVAVGAIHWLMPLHHHQSFRLVLEIASGAAAYIAAIVLLHRPRVDYFLSIVKRARKPKLETQPSVA